MKKLFCILGVILSLVLFTGCSELKTYEELSFDQVMEKLDNKEDFILFIGSSQCSHCLSYEPKLKQVIKEYQVKVYYIDVYELSDEENGRFNARISYGNATPITVFIKKGEETSTYNRIRGDQDTETIVKMFQKNGFIKE